RVDRLPGLRFGFAIEILDDCGDHEVVAWRVNDARKLAGAKTFPGDSARGSCLGTFAFSHLHGQQAAVAIEFQGDSTSAFAPPPQAKHIPVDLLAHSLGKSERLLGSCTAQ